jgi:hypothetical protein
MFAVFPKNDRGPHHERSLTCCIVCQKVHPTPSTCVSDRTTNDSSRKPNDRLTLDFTRMFVIRLANVCLKADQLILIHFDLFTYKDPPLSPSSPHFRPIC